MNSQKVNQHLITGTKQMSALKEKYGNIINDREFITTRVEECYGELYKSQNEEPIKSYPGICLEEIPPISQTEVAYALKQIKGVKPVAKTISQLIYSK